MAHGPLVSILVQCATIDTPAGGTPTYSTDGVTTQVSFACDKSYSLAGTVTLNCLTNGSWDEATPTCGECIWIPTNNNRWYKFNRSSFGLLLTCWDSVTHKSCQRIIGLNHVVNILTMVHLY